MTLLVKKNRPAFPSFIDEFFGRDFHNSFIDSHAAASIPAANVTESKDGYIIELATPGMTKEDFRIDLEKNTLSISTEMEESNEETTENFIRKEFNYRSFKRAFRLPKDVNAEKINASYTNGILRLELPKKEEAIDKGPKQISIK